MLSQRSVGAWSLRAEAFRVCRCAGLSMFFAYACISTVFCRLCYLLRFVKRLGFALAFCFGMAASSCVLLTLRTTSTSSSRRGTILLSVRALSVAGLLPAQIIVPRRSFHSYHLLLAIMCSFAGIRSQFLVFVLQQGVLGWSLLPPCTYSVAVV